LLIALQMRGRAVLARERMPPIWLWTVTVPGPPFGDASFKAAWLASKDKIGAEALAKAYAEMEHANRPDRYRR
jgi:hypothetical protein